MPGQTSLSSTGKPDDSHLGSLVSPLPVWLRRSIGKASELSQVQRIIKQRQIHTICEEGRCPNRGECYAQKTATFLLMGPTCTRACAFCQVDKGHAPMPLDPQEPLHVAESVRLLGLRYVVLTSVARDDLPDGGAGWFAATMEAIREVNPLTEIEVLTPDFWGGGAGTRRGEMGGDGGDGEVKSSPASLSPSLPLSQSPPIPSPSLLCPAAASCCGCGGCSCLL